MQFDQTVTIPNATGPNATGPDAPAVDDFAITRVPGCGDDEDFVATRVRSERTPEALDSTCRMPQAPDDIPLDPSSTVQINADELASIHAAVDAAALSTTLRSSR